MAIKMSNGAMPAQGQSAPVGAGWMKKGAASAKAVTDHEQEAQRRKSEQGLMFRWSLKKGEEGRLTFIDGDLSPEGFLLPPRYYEHTVQVSHGKYGNYVCPEKTNPGAGEKCPICEQGDSYASLVALFTVIDHREYTSKEGKSYKNRPKLLVVKTSSFEILNKYATKLGGLAGQTFEVSRSNGDKSPGIGDVFIPLEKTPTDVLKGMYTREVVDPKTNQKSIISLFQPADYEKEIVYYTAAELRGLGFGAGLTTATHFAPGQNHSAPAEYSAHL
jgi:hypothetical protein